MQEVKDFILGLGIYKTRYMMYLGNHHPDVLSEVYRLTKFLDETYPPGTNIRFAERIHCIMNGITERPICSYCHKNMVKFNRTFARYPQFCSKECNRHSPESTAKAKNTKIQRYGTTSYTNIEKSRETRKQKYGGWEPSDCVQKRRQTRIERYGSASYNNPERSGKTCLEKYGVRHPLELKSVQDKCRESFRNNHPGCNSSMDLASTKEALKRGNRIRSWRAILRNDSIEPCFSLEEYMEIKELNRNTRLRFRCKTCNKEFISFWDNGETSKCPHCFPGKTSKSEVLMYRWLDEALTPLGFNVLNRDYLNHSIIYPLEIDILIRDNTDKILMGIEYDGLYYHSFDQKGKSYHIRKTNLCREKGFPLVHIFENEWISHQDIVKRMIVNRLYNIISPEQISSETKDISENEAKVFMEKYHINGFMPSDVHIGAFNGSGEISYAMSLKLSRKVPGKWKITRFCTKEQKSTFGQLKQMLDFFVDRYSPQSISIELDGRWYDKNVLEQFGFVQKNFKNPIPWYFRHNDNTKIFDRTLFQKNRLDKILPSFDPNLSTHENMKNSGYLRIYDCGKIVMEYRPKR